LIDRRSLLATGVAAAAASTLAPGLAAAQAAPTVHRVRVGALEAFVINDGVAVRPDATQGLVVNASPAQVTAAMQAAGLTPPALANPFNVTIVRTPAGLVALDAGNTPGMSPTTGQLVANMRAAGLDPAQVVLVAHTHFHGDHIGGLTLNDGTAVFPNAQVAVPEAEWAFWTDAGEESRAAEFRRPGFANARRRLAPYAQRMTRFAPGATIAPGITAVASPGHSPGHVSFLVADGTSQLLVIGDAISTPAFFIANLEWFAVFDMDPPLAVATRRALLDRAAADRLEVVGYHFPFPATGRIERVGSGYRLVPSNA
jgi:glyoxylase-like metal-dependent hydrolase (beta-lactamase superfamily II)